MSTWGSPAKALSSPAGPGGDVPGGTSRVLPSSHVYVCSMKSMCHPMESTHRPMENRGGPTETPTAITSKMQNPPGSA